MGLGMFSELNQPINLWTMPTLAGLGVSPAGFSAEWISFNPTVTGFTNPNVTKNPTVTGFTNPTVTR